MTVETVPIPGPAGVPFLGNLLNIDSELPTKSLEDLADTYGEIYQLTLGGQRKVFVSSHALVNEVCDEKRFAKSVAGALKEVRNGVKDGLFTAYTGEEEWAVAHRVLLPAFGPLSIRGMYDEMYDIASQLVLKWGRQTSTTKIHVTDDFTRLTLDTIALCSMGARFNSYYSESMHPFVDAMVRFLLESGNRGRRPGVLNTMMSGTAAAYFADIDLMKKVSQDLVDERRKNPVDKKDLLNAMINGRDPKTGKGLSDDSIINNMITFLIAGHETTSGTLSFVFYNLLKHPKVYKAVQEEVDRVVGRNKVSVEHLSQLPYCNAVLRETLRLSSPITAFSLEPHPFDNHEDPIIIGGKYEIGKHETVIAMISKSHLDPKVYGEDAAEFKPERMLQEKFDALPKNAWKPFGNGMRGCIGRPFAWQEMLLVLAILFQNFNFHADDASYQMQLKQTLTVKPKDFFMRASLREGIDPTHLDSLLQVPNAGAHTNDAAAKIGRDAKPGKQPTKPMKIFYGSNTGTCEAFAGRLASDARRHGYDAQTDTLDSAVEKIPKDGTPVIIITASYEGLPPDNAAHFYEWLSGLQGDALKGAKFAVFGCGHHDWQATFHRIPKECDRLFLELGAEQICELGKADAAAGDMFTDFDNWEETKFWPSLGEDQVMETGSGLEVSVNVDTRSSRLGQQLLGGLVEETRVLTAPGEPEKRHIEIKLPTNMDYKVGDYLAVLPTNPSQDVRRVMRRFGLPWDAILNIQANGALTSLPTDVPISASDLLASYVELAQPATRRDVLAIAAAAGDKSKSKTELEELANDNERFATEISQARVSPIDLLEKYSDITLPIGDFLSMLPLMRVRQYSISSSPLGNPANCTLTFGVLNTISTAGNRKHLGVASNFLSTLEKGDHVQVSVRKSHGGFQLPLEVSTCPIICIAAGTGLAPFRGFIQERAAQFAAGRSLAPALLFIGCRAPGKDDIYADELARWEKMGAVSVRYAFSRETEKSEGCKYVQDRVWHDRVEAVKLFDQGAKVFVCGSREVGAAVKEVCMKMYGEAAETRGAPKTEEEVVEWFESLGKERFATDVFA